MRKTISTGSLFDKSNKNKFNKIYKKLSLKNSSVLQPYPPETTSLRKNKVIFASKVKSLGDISNIFSASTLSINNRPNIFDNSASNNQSYFTNDLALQRKLYDELMTLKKKSKLFECSNSFRKKFKEEKRCSNQ